MNCNRNVIEGRTYMGLYFSVSSGIMSY